MGKFNNLLSLAGFILIICVVALIVRTCANEPSISPERFTSTLVMMRADMNAALAVGGVKIAFDNNRKTQINRVSISASIRGDTWNINLQNEYVRTLSQRGWRVIDDSNAPILMCKNGALATIARDTARRGIHSGDGYITMSLSPATIMQCDHAAH
ncbi:hypothetical protein [Paraburkholderia solisilvae]|uniref:hypothetical protein n=1 Tax=Paraburkholderia solisilvae TaxID=624376 RepID=UPI001583947C|nr:hypothetical protein [Paraburkholderia solisilvae]